MRPFSEPTRQRRLPTTSKELPADSTLPQHQTQRKQHKATISLCDHNVAILVVLFLTIYAFANALMLLLPSHQPADPEVAKAVIHLPHDNQLPRGIQVVKPLTVTHTSERIRRRSPSGFPESITKHDMEVIPHPAILYGAKLPKNVSQTLIVPKFWKPPVHLDGRLMSKDEAREIGSTYDGHKTIFVAIASYRDPDCINTIESIYSRATTPERIRTVAVEQLKEGDARCTVPAVPCQDDPEQVLCKYRHLIRSYVFDARLAVGPTFARHIAHRHYRGEYFAMQVDSHVRFSQGYDEDLIFQWESARNEMAVLSTYLLDLNGALTKDTHQSTKTSRALLCNVYYEGSIIKNGQQAARPVADSMKGSPTIHPFWAAGFSFARGHYVAQVPYDGYLPMVFQGEEISMAVRAFTYGYDFYAPERNVCFHMYALNKNRAQRLKVPLFIENRKPFKGVEEQAMKRLTAIIQLNPPPSSDEPPVDYVRVEEDLYGLGSVRSPHTFYKTFGIHTESQTMENHLCWFVGENMQRRFLPHLRSDGMGIDYEALDYTFRDPAPDQD